MFGYSTSLRSLTEGRGNYTMEFDHYEPVPANVATQIIEGKNNRSVFLSLLPRLSPFRQNADKIWRPFLPSGFSGQIYRHPHSFLNVRYESRASFNVRKHNNLALVCKRLDFFMWMWYK